MGVRGSNPPWRLCDNDVTVAFLPSKEIVSVQIRVIAFFSKSMITYRAYNKKNGKWYVGSTVNFSKRKKEHLCSKQSSPFHSALRKDPDLFIWEIIEEDDREDRLAEQLILNAWYGSPYCYNLNPSAEGFNPENAVESGRKGLKILIERDPDHQSKAGKIGGAKGSREKKKKGGVKCKEEKLGMFSLTWEQRTEMSHKTMEKVNTQRWVDPDHPELGEHSAGTLTQMQKRRGLPHGKENRVRVY